jgi:eukaryotic-like serine/threonine-protein kinase
MATKPDTTRIGKYRLIGELGEGGMARVYLALVTGMANFNKLVVVKQIRPHLAEDPDFVTMFLDEARLAARLNHPNVVQTNEVGAEDGVYYIAMEYLEGQTFRRVLSRLSDKLTLTMKLRVIEEVLAGLDHAHELCDYDGTPLEVVHRDVSPHNVFVTYNGQVKVVDFGIAKAIDSSAETRTGMLKGKIGYMAPEQARGDKVDRRADIFALGVMLWEIITGQRLFKGDSEITVLHKLITHQIPRPSTVAPDVDPALEELVLRAVAAEPGERFQTAAEMSAALESWLREAGDHTSLREVGRVLAEGFATERQRIQVLVEAQIRQAEEQSGEVDQLVMLDQASQSIDLTGEPPTRTMTAATTVVLGAKPAAPAKRQPLLWVAIAAIVIGAIGAILILPRGDDGQVAAAPPSSAPPTAHQLRIESRPPGAEVMCGEAVVGTTPFETEVVPGETPCAYRIAKSGYEPLTLEPPAITANTTLQAPLVALAEPDPTASPTSTSTLSPGAPPPGPPSSLRDPPHPPPVQTAPPPPPAPDIRLER